MRLNENTEHHDGSLIMGYRNPWEMLTQGLDEACETTGGLAWEAVEFARAWVHANADDIQEWMEETN